MIFGQAKIIASPNLSWIFPGKRLKNFAKWLDFFEPNHQSMIISKKLSNKYDFQLNYGIISDGYWKRLIIKNAVDIIYIKSPIVKFYLDGVSSVKPTKKILIEIFENKDINFIRKIIFLIKFIFPKNLYILYFKIQKLKSLIVDLIFF